MKIFLFLFFALTALPETAFSQSDESSGSSIFIKGETGFVPGYQIKRVGTDYGSPIHTASFAFGCGFEIKIRNHWLLRSLIDSKTLVSRRTGIDSSNYATGGFVGYSDYRVNQSFQSVSLGFNFPFLINDFTISPIVMAGAPLHTTIITKDLTNGDVLKDKVRPSIWTWQFSLLVGHQLTEKTALSVGYNFMRINYNSDHDLRSDSPFWSFKGQMHSLEINLKYMLQP